ncbi:MAG: phosphopantothenoylcysteine decarboxylase [Opitutaceae bacterium]|jgi:phosphopantothenoylcysteine decarboxylase/phosphopantothenate--cysteine ligase|nr:phosphopantothenoylcysteine decarboxylase [Opitutaceae bacterium]
MPSNLLFLLTGSIACHKACSAISKLVQSGDTVQTVATPAALRFVGKATLEGLTHRPVIDDLWNAPGDISHIALGQWADAALLCPATANTLNRLAAGLADDPVGTAYLAWPREEKPWLVFPAMNPAMLAHPATQASLKLLAARGDIIVEPDNGPLACGASGAGRLPEPERIIGALRAALGR